MAILGLDLGTTHCKAGLFDDNMRSIRTASRPMSVNRSLQGWQYYDPQALIDTVASIIEEVTLDHTHQIAAIGISSMAETGLLLDRATGEVRSKLIPWFEPITLPFSEIIGQTISPLECYLKFGLKINYKSSLAKLLWLVREQKCEVKNAVWLSTADFIAFWLTGCIGTDYSQACRTLAFRLDKKIWDKEWLQTWGFSADLFPPAQPAGTPIGFTTALKTILPPGIPVSVCGHDHVCAAFGAGAILPGEIFDSMGTAETLVGAMPERPLTSTDFEIGMLSGCHVIPGMAYWMGGISASGGSIEWLRSLVPGEKLSYQQFNDEVTSLNPIPTRILYFPYLAGSSSPHTDSHVRGAMIGLSAEHKFSHICRAILEGNAYEMEFIRQAGIQMMSSTIIEHIETTRILASGGGTRLLSWLQIKADVTGCDIWKSPNPETALLGSALIAGVGSRIFDSPQEAIAAVNVQEGFRFQPNWENHRQYRQLFEKYLALQEPLRLQAR